MCQGKKIIQIVARGLKGEIGSDNKLLWHIPEDLKFFKDSTIGHVVLMGRNTVESLPKPLSRRVVFCISNSQPFGLVSYDLIDGLVEADSFSDELNTDTIFIAGGAKLYSSTFDIADELWITQVEKEYPEADTYYHIPDEFKMIEEVYGDCCDEVGIDYTFQKWVRV